MNSNSRGTGLAALAVILLLGLMALPLALSGNNPAEWLDKNHQELFGTDAADETVVYLSDEDYDTTVAAIGVGTDPDEQTTGTNLLPYVPAPATTTPGVPTTTPPVAGTTPVTRHPATFMRTTHPSTLLVHKEPGHV